MTRALLFRPADVACLLSASNRRADIVRATPIRSIAESRRECYDTFRLADAKQQAFTQRPYVGLSPKQPVSARVAPGLRTQTFAGDQPWPVQPSGPASYRVTGERRLYRAKPGGKPAIDYVRRLCPRITSRSRQAADFSCLTLFQSSRATSNMKSHRNAGQVKLRGKRSKALYCGCCDVRDLRFDYFKRLDRKDCLTLSPRPPDQSGDPASSYRIGAPF